MRASFAPSDNWHLAWADEELVLIGPADEAEELFPDGRPAGSYVAQIEEADYDVLIVPNVRRQRTRDGSVRIQVPPVDEAPPRIRRIPEPEPFRVRKVSGPRRSQAYEPPRRVAAPPAIDVAGRNPIRRLRPTEQAETGLPRRRLSEEPPRIVRSNSGARSQAGSAKYVSAAPPSIAPVLSGAKKPGNVFDTLQKFYWLLQNPIITVPAGIVLLIILYLIFKGPIDTLFACMQGMNTRGCRMGLR